MVFSLIGLGIIVGFVFRKKELVFKLNEKFTMYSIYLLLFLLGVSVGMNEEIISNIDKIGLDVFVITLGAVLGSVIASWILFKTFFRNH
ncbi:MAG: LysO family transporter [Candidatus Delongbacteria bacterium]|nr:LysO family transporter [Candidatus Delongbacteria bacterium]MBN2836455.1 LysO family transporter [Candidatus Delongbacteria bacterium]